MSFQSFSNDNNCENQNPLSRLSQQLFLNQAERNTRGVSQAEKPNATQLVTEYLDETFDQNFQTFESDVLFEQIKAVETNSEGQPEQPPGVVGRRPAVPVVGNMLGTPESHCVHWIPYPAPAIPLDRFFCPNPVPHSIYPSYPILSPSVFPEAPSSHPQITSFPLSPDFSPSQSTTEDPKTLWDWSDNDEAGIEDDSAFSKNKIDKKKKDENNGVHSTPQTSKFDFGDPLSEDGKKGANPSLDVDERSAYLDLDTIIEELEGNDLGMQMWELTSLQVSFSSKNEEPKENSQTLQSEDSSHGKRDARTEETKQTVPIPPKDLIGEIEEQLLGLQAPPNIEQVYDDIPLNIFDNYRFRQYNPMALLEEPLTEGLRNLIEGNVSASALCFEAALSKTPPITQNEAIIAWQGLGISQAANEQDVLAIIALKEFLKYKVDDLHVLMFLTVSYVNEGYKNLAIITLWNWLSKNRKYSSLVDISPPEDMYFETSPMNLEFHSKLVNLFIQAANSNPFKFIDPDIQCALGLLYNLVNDYSKSTDCFNVAVQIESADEAMWNHLGEAHINNENYADSFTAFYRALNLRPKYARAQYNLGVSFSKIGDHQEAMKNFLKALNIQAKSSRGLIGRLTEAMWSSVKTTIGLLKRADLEKAVEERDLVSLKRAFGLVDGDWLMEDKLSDKKSVRRYLRYIYEE